jgi:hypothetical protein
MSRVYEAMRRLSGNTPEKTGAREEALEDFAHDEAALTHATRESGPRPVAAPKRPAPKVAVAPIETMAPLASEAHVEPAEARLSVSEPREQAGDQPAFHSFLRPADNRSFRDLILDIAQDEWEQSMEDR